MAGAIFTQPFGHYTLAELQNGSVEFYLTGTTTAVAVYSDQALSSSLGPIVTLNASGRPQSGAGAAVDIYLDPTQAYKVIIKNASGTTVRTIDPYRQHDPNVAERPTTDYTANDDIDHVEGLHRLGGAGARTMLLSNPTSIEEGIVLHIRAMTAAAHTVQVTGGYAGQGSGADVATFGGAIGDGMLLIAVNQLWHVIALRNVTLG